MMRAAAFRHGFATLVLATAYPALAADQALVIGIDAYPDLALSQPLTGAKADAERFRDLLISKMGFAPESVTLLTDAQASASKIMEDVVNKLIGESGPEDRVVFYFAGLGARLASPGGTDGRDVKEVLLAHDAPALLGNIPRASLAEILDLLSERNVTVVIDASFQADARDLAGGFALSRSLRLEASEDGTGPSSDIPFGAGATERAVWNAAAPDQYAWEMSGRGVFTDAFLDGLGSGTADANGNGTITNAELLTFLRDRSETWCMANADCLSEGGALLPHFSGSLQDAALLSAAPVQDDETSRPEPQLLPISTLQSKDLNLTDTLGFVTDLFTPSNDANLHLDLSKDGPLRIGESVRFSVSAERAGTLVLLDVNPRGELAQIFPSSLAMTGTTQMKAGETLTIPNGVSSNGAPLEIRVTEPAGNGFLLGLFIEDELPSLTAILPENLLGGPVPNAGQYLYQIAQELLRLQADGSGSVATEWSATYLPYEIIP